MAVLLPVFGRVRENARRATCQSNLKQIALGFAQYKQDYDNRYPSARYWPGYNTDDLYSTTGWVMVLQPYLRTKQIFQCPSEPQRGNNGDAVPGWASTPIEENRYFTDYYVNALVCPEGTTGGITDSKLVAPISTVLLGDGSTSASQWLGWRGEPYYSRNTTDISENGALGDIIGQERHLGGANYAFADGHIKWLHASLVRPGTDCTVNENKPGVASSTFCVDERDLAAEAALVTDGALPDNFVLTGITAYTGDSLSVGTCTQSAPCPGAPGAKGMTIYITNNTPMSGGVRASSQVSATATWDTGSLSVGPITVEGQDQYGTGGNTAWGQLSLGNYWNGDPIPSGKLVNITITVDGKSQTKWYQF